MKALVSDTLFLLNEAEGGAGEAGGNGGDGLGGAVFNGGAGGPFAAADLTLLRCLVAFNEANGGSAGKGGSDGHGIGGGVYNLGTLELLMTEIALNHASTSNDNLFP